jgi:tartronate-semialdehyde synthase
MEQNVSLAFENINSPETNGYGVDHLKVVEGLGCKAVRVTDPEKLQESFAEAHELLERFRVPVVVEVVLEKVTNISMGTEIDNVVEFEELAERGEDAPTAIALLD